jgi:uncharacterized protein YqfA (UPF0365 family)
MDYYNLRNLQADTEMRTGIGKVVSGGESVGEGSTPTS